MIYPARVSEVERTWTENGWQTINRISRCSEPGAITVDEWGWELLDPPQRPGGRGRQLGPAFAPSAFSQLRMLAPAGVTCPSS
jgi:hypothetical protein